MNKIVQFMFHPIVNTHAIKSSDITIQVQVWFIFQTVLQTCT